MAVPAPAVNWGSGMVQHQQQEEVVFNRNKKVRH